MTVQAPDQPHDTSVKKAHLGYRDGDIKIHTHSYSDKPTPFWNHDLMNPGAKEKFSRYASEHTDEKHLKEYGKKFGKKYGKRGLNQL